MTTDTKFEFSRVTMDDVAQSELEWFEAVHAIHQRMLQEMDMSAIEKLSTERAREAVSVAARQLVSQTYPSLLGDDRERVIKRVIDEAIGFGPIQNIIDDDSVSEVMVNAPDEIFFEREGVIYLSPLRFRDNQHIMRVVERIIAPLGRRVDESSPYVDARLPDGSRVNIVIPPLVPRSPTLTIRKFRREKFKIADLVANGTIPEDITEFLRMCVQQRLNVVISGGTGTGKTTLLNAMTAFISNSERIISIEDPIEMKVQQGHCISMEARPPNIEGKNEVTQRDLVRNALRMRPDRIIVGEVRGSEAFDMLQAMNTGHEGSMATIHANTPRDAISRLEQMIGMAGMPMTVASIRGQIAAAIRVIVQLQRMSDGKRRVTSISEITGLEGDIIQMQEIYKYVRTGTGPDGTVEGHFQATGVRPRFLGDLIAKGINIPGSHFDPSKPL